MATALLECGHPPTESDTLFETGYAVDHLTNKRMCYPCSADFQKAFMTEHGKCTLYLTTKIVCGFPFGEVTDWPGRLRFKVYEMTTGKHNIAGTVTFVWFTGPDDKPWIGKQYGSNSDICHCNRLKKRRYSWERDAN